MIISDYFRSEEKIIGRTSHIFPLMLPRTGLHLCTSFSPIGRLIYTLAVFYLITTVTGVVWLGLGAYQIFLSDRRSIALMDVVVATVTLFNFSTHLANLRSLPLVRCIYFFVTNQGAKGAVVDYILAVLPSFLYLTSFTIVLAYW